MEIHPSDWRNAPARVQTLAALALAGIVGGVISLAIFSRQAAETKGPDLIAQNAAGDVLLADLRNLYLVASGERTEVILLADLGLRGPATAVSSDGSSWFIGDDASGTLHRCDLERRVCEGALQSDAKQRVIRRAHSVAFADERIYITDAERHRLLVFDREGKRIAATRTEPVALCFPNGLIAVDGALYAADTNNLRIARIDPHPPYRSETLLHTGAGKPIAQANCNDRSSRLTDRGTPVVNTAIDSTNTRAQRARPPARADRVWPASVLRSSSGQWWVIQQDNGMRMGDVVVYDAAGKPLKRVELPQDADPVDLIETSDGILITDANLAQVHRVSLEGEVLGRWGPKAFVEQMDSIRERRTNAHRLRALSIGGIGLGIATALAVVILELRRQRREGWSRPGVLTLAARTPLPLPAEVVWMSVHPDAVRRFRQAGWILHILMAIVVAAAIMSLKDVDLDTRGEQALGAFLLIMTLLTLALMFGIGRALKRSLRMRIGVSSTEVLFDPGGSELVRSPLADVRAGPLSVLIGRRLVALLDQWRRPIFPAEMVEGYLLSRLPAQAFLKGGRLELEALRRGNAGLWCAVAGALLCVALMVLDHVGRDLPHELAKRLVELFG